MNLRRIAFGQWASLPASLVSLYLGWGIAHASPPQTHDRLVEWTIESRKPYKDPFNDVDVDVVFARAGNSWRVPAFWSGGQRWTVRFAPPIAGDYQYHFESTDSSNSDLNGHAGHVTISAYSGTNALLIHGPIRLSQNRRYFEHADGTPFYWLGDTWWTGLSTRLSWKGFQKLTADRRAKGFTVVQVAAGLVPEEICPIDPGCRNEGGPVWDPGFHRINPRFFDFADRRIEELIHANIAPAIVGAWSSNIDQLGASRLKKHWRYIIARYGAYPVFWIVGGEVFDPPVDVYRTLGTVATIAGIGTHLGQWTDIARYVRTIDPYHHPLTVHEWSPDDPPLQEESLTDFRLFQPSHFGWSSIAVEIAQLNLHRARPTVVKPLVVGEIGYEMLARTHLQDFQRVAFWMAMLNGAAGFTYGAAGTWESYTTDQPIHRKKWSLLTWEEGMKLPGSYQVGLGARFIRRFPWWQFKPHPDWVTPHGTTLFIPRGGRDNFHIDLMSEWGDLGEPGLSLPESEWKKHGGNFRLPYAAGVPSRVRLVYLPFFAMYPPDPPTILRLEPEVRYRAYYWEPSLGAKIELGEVKVSPPGPVVMTENFVHGTDSWTKYSEQCVRTRARLPSAGPPVILLGRSPNSDLVGSVSAHAGIDTGIILRYQDAGDYVSGVYSSAKKAVYLQEHHNGSAGPALGFASVGTITSDFRLTMEVRGQMGILSLMAGGQTTTTPIVPLSLSAPGDVGLECSGPDASRLFQTYEVREGAPATSESLPQRTLIDAMRRYRGTLQGAGLDGAEGWDDYGKHKHILLDAYRPERPPMPGDWLLVLETARHDDF